jgi:alkanesulfonate monooxygenase SsuD/methylene tetrahydromethanopterin reductase-like flavin-dependent oxidoreductase (luciferase family)
LRERRVRYDGETVRIEGFDFWFIPSRRTIPIYVFARFPEIITASGEIADGAHCLRGRSSG